MQTILTYLSILCTSIFLQAQNTIEVTVTGFSSEEGKAVIGLYNEKGDFLENEFRGGFEDIENYKVNMSFIDVPDGIYAVSVFHDEDNDQDFDMIFGIIALEDYGNSNNIPPRFGPPEWEDAKFEVKNGAVVKTHIKLL